MSLSFSFSYSGGVNDHLHVLDGRAIVEGNEIDCLRAAVRTHPALHADFLAIFGVTEDINDFCSFHFSFILFSRCSRSPSYSRYSRDSRGLEILVFLFEGTHAEHVNFLLGEEAPIAATEILLGETGKLHAVELNDTIAKALEDTAHDAVLAGMDLNAYL